MGDPVIVNRAVSGPPEGGKPVSPLAAVWGGIEAIARRLIALEARPLARNGIDGAAGKDGAPGRDGKDGKDGIAGQVGRGGKDADTEAIRQIVTEEVAKAIAAIPAPAPEQRKRKTIVTKHAEDGRILEFVQEDV